MKLAKLLDESMPFMDEDQEFGSVVQELAEEFQDAVQEDEDLFEDPCEEAMDEIWEIIEDDESMAIQGADYDPRYVAVDMLECEEDLNGIYTAETFHDCVEFYEEPYEVALDSGAGAHVADDDALQHLVVAERLVETCFAQTINLRKHLLGRGLP